MVLSSRYEDWEHFRRRNRCFPCSLVVCCSDEHATRNDTTISTPPYALRKSACTRDEMDQWDKQHSRLHRTIGALQLIFWIRKGWRVALPLVAFHSRPIITPIPSQTLTIRSVVFGAPRDCSWNQNESKPTVTKISPFSSVLSLPEFRQPGTRYPW